MHENETVRSSIKISLWRNEKERAAERDARRRSAPNSEFIESWSAYCDDDPGRPARRRFFADGFFLSLSSSVSFFFLSSFIIITNHETRAESRERERFFVHFFELFIVK